MDNTANVENIKSLNDEERQKLAKAIVDEIMERESLKASLELPEGHRFRIFSAKPTTAIVINGERRA